MIESEQLHPYVELIAREARRPVITDRSARDRIMAAVHADGAPGHRIVFWKRIVEPRSFRLSPALGGLLAAGLVGIGVVAGGFSTNRDGRVLAGQSTVAAAGLPVSDTVVKFVFLAPQAANVSLVGDFNGWDATKVPMVRTPNSGLWTVTLPLTAGRHLYQFVVDGDWTSDPNAPTAGDDGFGHANSVRLVQKGSAL